MKYVIEHLESEFSEWVKLEYIQILKDVGKGNLILSSLPKEIILDSDTVNLENNKDDLKHEKVPLELKNAICTHDEVVNLPGLEISRTCLLDPQAKYDLSPEDSEKFDYFVFGGILGDDPPQDRTGVLRKYGFEGRRLGPVQMTTDTAVRVTLAITKDKKNLNDIPIVDYPEIRFSKRESVEMPFRYVTDKNGDPILPEGMKQLIKKDSSRAFEF